MHIQNDEWTFLFQNQVDQFKADKEPSNSVTWQCFSVALDRLGIVLFTFTLIVGSGTIFTQMKENQ
jgi:hypothetical protein